LRRSSMEAGKVLLEVIFTNSSLLKKSAMTFSVCHAPKAGVKVSFHLLLARSHCPQRAMVAHLCVT
jgi:hypothetical protein